MSSVAVSWRRLRGTRRRSRRWIGGSELDRGMAHVKERGAVMGMRFQGGLFARRTREILTVGDGDAVWNWQRHENVFLRLLRGTCSVDLPGFTRGLLAIQLRYRATALYIRYEGNLTYDRHELK